ncbi:MAG: phospho-N-acetylmuramoyl-pentapeptide-transferase [Anaerococcus vaginalis]|uniref:phospho-N-acetylmuramoyl-pentapeptide- transferase n=1 Tax=Anaerococcus TaxID=165779 RepID=UPI0008A2D263|nr:MULTISPECIES: phospho-N-acetylmuramoyl-pentapeptide-transferase [Anaerococcus]MDU5085839.1 phospho-N-acetylmuramoyl-pentapeptide-transferase [Anaerococcus vaginalis]OFL16760.1 phospho-N-acetylmuramoyl-pentapeptide-transferase [Anaerococcus sp. HMSC068A02]
MKNTILIILISLILTLILGKIIIPILRSSHIGQNIRQEGPKSHYGKAGTPTMGGIIFLISALVLTLIFVPFSMKTFILLLATFGFGAIGFIDDFRKLILKRSLGLTAKQKIILQVALSFLIAILCSIFQNDTITKLWIPFTDIRLNVSILGIPIMMFIMIGTSNAVNLTDGLDGLSTQVSIPVFLTFIILSQNIEDELFASIMLGSVLGFLFYNSNPASVFMGDTGSMAIGGAVVGLAINMGMTLFLIILGGVYVAEALSVIIQVASYKFRNKKRIFLMTPIHHHYELKGYKEPKIVTGFTIVSVILSLITLLALL